MIQYFGESGNNEIAVTVGSVCIIAGLSLMWLRDTGKTSAVFPQTKAVRQVKADIPHYTSMVSLQQTKGLSGQSTGFLPSLGGAGRTEDG